MNKKHTDMIVIALATIVIGIILLVNPESALSFMARAVGIVLCVAGVFTLISHFRRKQFGLEGYTMMGLGLFALAVGLYMAIHPRGIQKIIAVVFALILLLHGIGNIREARIARRFNDRRWVWPLVAGIVCIALGIIVLLRPFASVALPFRVIGIFLVFDGLADLFVAIGVHRD